MRLTRRPDDPDDDGSERRSNCIGEKPLEMREDPMVAGIRTRYECSYLIIVKKRIEHYLLLLLR